MEFVLGSMSEEKFEGLLTGIMSNVIYKKSMIHSIDAPSGIRDQPISLKEIVTGANNRAVYAYDFRELDREGVIGVGVGIESGLQFLEGGNYLQTSICSIYNGSRVFIGQSVGFEHPGAVSDSVLSKGLSMNEAYEIHGYKLEGKKGISALTHGRVRRLDLLTGAVDMALVSYSASNVEESS